MSLSGRQRESGLIHFIFNIIVVLLCIVDYFMSFGFALFNPVSIMLSTLKSAVSFKFLVLIVWSCHCTVWRQQVETSTWSALFCTWVGCSGGWMRRSPAAAHLRGSSLSPSSSTTVSSQESCWVESQFTVGTSLRENLSHAKWCDPSLKYKHTCYLYEWMALRHNPLVIVQTV